MDAVTLVGLLAEPVRRKVVAALLLGSGSDLASATGFPSRDVLTALTKLQAAGLVDDELRVREELFTEAARAAAPEDPGPDDVVGRFVRDGRIVSLPAPGTKRRLVLEHVASSFEPGRHFPEREVDAVLRAWTDGGAADHVTLRRYLVDHGLLSRGEGEYWRSGGWIDVLEE